MPPTNTPSTTRTSVNGRAEAVRFLKEHLPLVQILQATRDRFAEIDVLLEREGINRHDQGHQMRTTINAVRAMRELGFDHREIVQAAAGGLIHDVGYNKADTSTNDTKNDDYLGGTKAQFKRHALTGAIEVNQKLNMLRQAAEAGGPDSAAAKLISYVDANGDTQMIDETDIAAIIEAILHHNDYGKDDKHYDPKLVGKGALMIQLFDKMDHCSQRVFKERMTPETFVEGSDSFDPRYYHRVAPYCITSYDYKIDQATGTMRMVYQVDLERFRQIMRKHDAAFEYTEEDYVRDFQRAYTKNSRIAAEAIGTILDNDTDEPTMIVEFQFADGGSRELAFARPDRTKEQMQAKELRVSLEEILAGKGKSLKSAA